MGHPDAASRGRFRGALLGGGDPVIEPAHLIPPSRRFRPLRSRRPWRAPLVDHEPVAVQGGCGRWAQRRVYRLVQVDGNRPRQALTAAVPTPSLSVVVEIMMITFDIDTPTLITGVPGCAPPDRADSGRHPPRPSQHPARVRPPGHRRRDPDTRWPAPPSDEWLRAARVRPGPARQMFQLLTSYDTSPEKVVRERECERQLIRLWRRR